MIEWIVSSAVLIVVVSLVRQLLKGKISLRLQYALWAIVLVRLLVPITFGESKISVLNVLDQAASVVEQQEPLEEPTVSDPGWEPIGGTADPIPSGTVGTPSIPENPYPVISEQPEPVVPIVPDPGMNSDPVTEPEPPAVDEPSEAPTVSPAQILTLFWLCGIVVVGLWFLFTNLRFWLRLRRSRRELALDCPIRVYVTGAVETPCLFGLIHPAVYMTPEVAGSREVMHHVLAHELTHYHHWDHIWSVLRCVCLALHWYNPLVWLAASLSRRDAELACDESTIRRIGEGERAAYGRTLIGLTCAHRSNLLHTATTMTGSKKSIKERIVLIAQKPKMAIYTLVAVILIAAIAVGCTFTGAKEKEWDVVQFTCEGVEGYLEGKVSLAQGNRLDIMVQNMTSEYFQIDKFWDLYQKDEDGQWAAIKVNPTDEWANYPKESMIQPGKKEGPSWNGFYIGLDGEELPEGAYRVKTSAWWLIDPSGDTWRDWTKGEEFFLIIEFAVTEDGEVKLNGDADLTELMYIPEELLPGKGNITAPAFVQSVAETYVEQQRTAAEQGMVAISVTHEVLSELKELSELDLGTADLYYAVEMWQLDYDITVTIGRQQEAHTMAHTVFLVVLYDCMANEYTQLLGAVDLQTLQDVYNTPEMIGKYNDMYRAAAVELYHEWQEEQTDPADPLAYFQNLLTFDGGTTHYNGAMTCVYDSPEDINLEYVFYTGFPGGEGWSDFTEEEKAYLIAEGMRTEIEAQKRYGLQLEQALQAYFGVSLSQVQIPDSWVYYKDTNSYYSSHGDTHVMERFTVTKVERGEDGLVYVYYTAEGPIFRQDGTTLDGWEHDMVLTLRTKATNLVSPNGYVVVSNQTQKKFEDSYSFVGAAVDPAQISVQAKTPYQAAGNYVTVWGRAYTAQMPYLIRDYRLLDWGVEEISADGKAVSGWLNCSILPTREYDVEGGIEFFVRNDGYLNGSLSFVLEEQDGIWTVAGWDKLEGISLADCGYTPMEEIEATVTGFLNEYLTELYCCTNSNWLDYTTGGIHLYSVDELSGEEQAIVWAADQNISYLEDKATYWKLSRRYYETYPRDFAITFADMKVSRNGMSATVNLNAFVSFYYEGETEQSITQSPYEIQLAKIGGTWLITDVMEEVFWFDYDYKNDREALDKEIEYWESFSTSKIQQYDLNGDGMIQSVEFPYAEGEAFGLTGEYATLYTAVAEYAGRWLAHEAGGTYLVLPSITKVYGQYKDGQGNMNYICFMNTHYFDALGSAPGNWKYYNLGWAGDFVLATIDPEGNLVGFKTWPNSPGRELANQLYREYCGPLEDLAEAFINGTQIHDKWLLEEYPDADTILAQYLSYYFGE